MKKHGLISIVPSKKRGFRSKRGVHSVARSELRNWNCKKNTDCVDSYGGEENVIKLLRGRWYWAHDQWNYRTLMHMYTLNYFGEYREKERERERREKKERKEYKPLQFHVSRENAYHIVTDTHRGSVNGLTWMVFGNRWLINLLDVH